ncbi:hypothetical protein Sm713_63870 [Streptomyces sp. TS71-3]|nr:hypothetical protein Sm713_63870 [Streptomyces sp. TS71-3]
MIIRSAVDWTLPVPTSAWTPAVEPGGEIRDGAGVAELGGDVLDDRPKGMRLRIRRNVRTPRRSVALHRRRRHAAHGVPHQHKNVPIAALEPRHRQRACAEDHIRTARVTGLRNLPLHDAAQNQS